MKLFVIDVDKTEWDECDAISVLAETKDRAIELAIKQHEIFIDNIDNIEEVDIYNEGVVLESIKWG